MANICTLAPDINKCSYYDPDCGKCNKPEQECLFLEIMESEPPQPESHTEKWFEKYWK